ncbi:protein FAM83C [Lepisosteus oculatus]|uniref:protein FAM83C n=1 Tax=Lepisosteus oculatus TaxID=7918 RepID=UPI0035F525BE
MMNSEALRPSSSNTGRKPLGKLSSRVEDVKNPWRQGSPLEFSHNEAARLATDALLESGETEYRRVLSEEREVSFLSPLEIKYITETAAKNISSDNSNANGSDRDSLLEGDAVSMLTSGTYFPMMSDEEPPALELGWPEMQTRHGPSETQVYFQRDRSHNLKDHIRSLISKAKTVIAIVMDLFTDVDLFCDLMEASNKRKVPVYILLDERNLQYFINMCQALDVRNTHLGNMRIRSVCGDTYCTKSGKKFTGQVQEKFLIIDCEEVIAGSYSFTWLSAQVHSNMVLHFSGRIAELFDHEFRCLYADSEIIDCFHNPDEEGLPRYCSGLSPANWEMNIRQEKPQQLERVSSENSSSLSGNSFDSIKKAPGMPIPTYKVNHEKKEPNSGYLSPERRGQNLVPYNQNSQGRRGSANGLGLTGERSGPGHSPGIEWSKAGPDHLGRNMGGLSSKIHGLGLYEPKQNIPQNAAKSPPPHDPHPTGKQKTITAPILSKISDFFISSAKDRETFAFRKSPPHSMAFGGPDLSQMEPECKPPFPPVPPAVEALPAERQPRLSRHDEKRMTLGHSKLDLVNQYNKMKSKQVYSRFELVKNSNN